ncbi:hypothetical protein EST38_g7019 [Candolleomyces aberdarensis]|uniref:Uncharacterized protein n=1 Tax=Candolleomyces aberdarensis TaxID=2316362 RepID=A0A4Q2DIB9_9AGAR|nr:hypothetical protein EST38_g7019 [Candolleomyces aberdarensis]
MKAPRPDVNDWGICTNCGNTYEHLEVAICSICEDTDGTVQVARDAIANPVNPRAHTGPDGRASLSSRVQAPEQSYGNAVDIENRARQALAHMANGYADAVSNAMPGVRVAPSKLKSSNAVSKAVKRLSVRISKVTDYDNGRYRTGPQFNAISTSYTEDTPMSEIIEQIQTIADNAYTKHREYRVDLNDITLLWTTSKTTATPDWLQGTLGDLWRKAQTNLLCVSPTDAKRSVLDFHVVVDYDPTRLEEECYESKVEKRHVTARKTKRANSVVAADLHLRSSANAAAKKPR